MPDFSAAIALLKKPIEDIYSLASGALKLKIAGLRAAGKLKSLHKKLYESQRVKTIWNTDRPLSLSSFFHPVSVLASDESGSKSVRLSSLNDLPSNCYVVYGTVGQGKSILLRYLLGKEIRSGERIPVLLELRNFSSNSLVADLSRKFSTLLGIDDDPEIFDVFARAGRVSFLLDGFDEIEPANVHNVTQQIEELSYRFEASRILLTSRPDSECRHLTRFSSIRIAPLESTELEGFYKRITRDQEFTNRLVAAIKTSPLKIRELVRTPLLATLLAISYRAAHKIPLDFAEFYDELFQILLVRHDGSKLGWRRHRKTTLNDREIQEIFEAFCFATRKRQTSSINSETAYGLAKESIDECQRNTDPQHFLDDIRKITCLLVEEGKKLAFVHLSVQEFFAARYIKTRPETAAASFYSQLVAGNWEKWQEELLFLRQIDSHRATKYFTIPDLTKTLRHLLKEDTELKLEALERFLNELHVSKSVVNRDGKEVESFTVGRVPREANTFHYKNLASAAFSQLFSTTYQGARPWRFSFAVNPRSSRRTYLEIAADMSPEVTEALKSRIKGLVAQLIRDSEELGRSVSRAEVPRSFMDIS